MFRSISFTAILLGSAALSVPATAQDGPDGLSMTIYNGDLTLVTDTRTLNLKKGEQVVELPGVSSRIQPTTATFIVDGVEIMEQNFDFDLLSPEKLMEKAVGSYIEVVRTNPGNGNVQRDRAKVLSVNNGVVVEIDGRIEILHDDDIPTRVVFPEVPENLRADPTLSVMIDSERGGRRDATLTYLTNGLSWKADYVANFNEAEETIDLQGWATLTNNTETTFRNAEVVVLAGNVNSTTRRSNPRFDRRNGMISAGTEAVDTDRAGDNYIYDLGDDITVRANQTKQVGIVNAVGIPADKTYEYNVNGFGSVDAQPVNISIRTTNTGTVLPAGAYRIYGVDSVGRSQFLGEDRLGHTPASSVIASNIGEAFDLRVQPTLVETDLVSTTVKDFTMKYRVTNASKRPVTVDIIQNLPGYWQNEYIVREESIEHVRRNAFTWAWPVEVEAEGETVLDFTVRVRSTPPRR